MRSLKTLLFAAAMLSWGCASTLPPVALEGPRSNFDELVGEWAGEYVTDGVDAVRGSIYFALVAGEDHAHGNVLMTPAEAGRATGDREPVNPSARPMRPVAEVRNIHFVHSAGGQVSGTLDPVWDAVRDCWSWTIFRGDIKDGAIIGTFRTTYARPFSETTGRWRVNLRRR